jgi:hypothetical protein
MMSELNIQNAILEIKNIDKSQSYWFNYFNTLVSYTNYELAFLDLDNNIVQQYKQTLLGFIFDLNIDIDSQTLIVKTVYLNNLSVLYKLSSNSKILDEINIIKSKYFLNEYNGMETFSNFY